MNLEPNSHMRIKRRPLWRTLLYEKSREWAKWDDASRGWLLRIVPKICALCVRRASNLFCETAILSFKWISFWGNFTEKSTRITPCFSKKAGETLHTAVPNSSLRVGERFLCCINPAFYWKHFVLAFVRREKLRCYKSQWSFFRFFSRKVSPDEFKVILFC
jgi:hypothetical protein